MHYAIRLHNRFYSDNIAALTFSTLFTLSTAHKKLKSSKIIGTEHYKSGIPLKSGKNHVCQSVGNNKIEEQAITVTC